MEEVREILNERQARHGAYETHARISQSLKRVLRDLAKNADLNDMQAEALDMILHKVARVVNGDPDYRDHWLDIAGYATLVADKLPHD